MNIKQIAAAIEADAGVELPGLEQSLAEMKSGKQGRVYSPAQMLVREVRTMVHYSQTEFATAIETPVNSLRDWEQGRHEPPGVVTALMNVIKKHPKIIHEMETEHA